MKEKCMYINFFLHISVVNAAHTFYSGTTSVPIDKNDPVRKRKTNLLNTTTNPEEKRKIIGDTFMKVSPLLAIMW